MEAQIPHLPEVIKAIAGFHMKVLALVEGQDPTTRIGKNKREGGNYVFDQRRIFSVLRAIQMATRGWRVDTDNSGNPQNILDLEQIIKGALRDVYIDGMTLGHDQDLVTEQLEGLPIWEHLRNILPPGIKGVIGAKSKVTNDGVIHMAE